MQNGFDILERTLSFTFMSLILSSHITVSYSPESFPYNFIFGIILLFFSSFIVLKANFAILSKTVMDFSPLIAAAGLVALSPFLDSNLAFLPLPFAFEIGRNWRKTPD